ncbi:hypothetical protein HZB96_03905 [Candidatus Gottesmanbacteria bacterium]|nr:hypothetical protein [Candidatus Gottesmanbacteria bacterium]
MKKIIILITVLLVVIFLVILAVRSLFSNKPEVTEVDPTPTIVLPTVSENIKVDLTHPQ